MERNKQVIRILKIIHYLELNPHGLTVDEIKKKLESEQIKIAPRTIYRDFEAIETLHLPIENDGDKNVGRWKLNRMTQIANKVNVSYQELFALFVARGSLRTFQGSPIFDALESFFDKLEKTMGPQAQQAFSEFISFVNFKPNSAWHTKVSQEILDTLHSGCAEGQVLEIEYQSVHGENAGKTKTRKVGPEYLLFNEAGAYLVAKDLIQGDVKTYALPRIRSAILTEDHYEATITDGQKSLKDNFGILSVGSVQEVEILIQEPIASFVAERRWHESQRVIRVAGGIKLKLEVRINEELARWILSLGPAARVESPPALIAKMQELSEEIFKQYKKTEAA